MQSPVCPLGVTRRARIRGCCIAVCVAAPQREHDLRLSAVCVTGYLEGEVGDDAGDSEDNQQQVGEDEGSGGVDDLLDLFIGSAGLAGLPDQR